MLIFLGVKYSPSKTCPKWPPQLNIISIRCPSASTSCDRTWSRRRRLASRNSNETYLVLGKELVTLFACVEAVCEMISVFSRKRSLGAFGIATSLLRLVCSLRYYLRRLRGLHGRKICPEKTAASFIDFLKGVRP